MADKNYRTDSDAPSGWEGYSRLLREHGGRSLRSGLAEQMEQKWRERLAARRIKRRRWKFGLPTGVALVTGILLLVDPFASNEEYRLMPAIDSPTPLIIYQESDIFASPAIPPVWYDSTMPLFDVELPAMSLDSKVYKFERRIPAAVDTPVAGEPVW